MRDWDTWIPAWAFKFTIGGFFSTVYGWVTSSEGATLIGLVLAVGGFVVNWYYQHQRHKRETALAEAVKQRGETQ